MRNKQYDFEKLIKPMELVHVEQVVQIHMSSFQNFFLTFLGPSFLSHFYKGVVESSLGIEFVIIENGAPVGFVCGSINPSKFYKELLKRKWLQFCFSALPAAVSRPVIIPRLLRAVTKPNEAEKGINRGMLMSIGVHPSVKGKGYGKALVTAFVDAMKGRKVNEVSLTTDRYKNDSLNAFYQKMGFVLRRFFLTPEGRWMNEYAVKFNDNFVKDV